MNVAVRIERGVMDSLLSPCGRGCPQGRRGDASAATRAFGSPALDSLSPFTAISSGSPSPIKEEGVNNQQGRI